MSSEFLAFRSTVASASKASGRRGQRDKGKRCSDEKQCPSLSAREGVTEEGNPSAANVPPYSQSTTSDIWNIASVSKTSYSTTSTAKWAIAQWRLAALPATKFTRRHPRQASELAALLCRYIFARYKQIVQSSGPPCSTRIQKISKCNASGTRKKNRSHQTQGVSIQMDSTLMHWEARQNHNIRALKNNPGLHPASYRQLATTTTAPRWPTGTLVCWLCDCRFIEYRRCN